MKHTMKILPLSSSAALAALLLTGCGGEANDPAPEDQAETAAVAPESESTADPGNGEAVSPREDSTESPASEEQNGGQAAAVAAVETVLNQYRGGEMTELDYDRHDDAFDVDVIQNNTKHEVTLDATGQSITGEKENGSADQDDLDELGKVSVSIKEAIDRAFAEASSQEGTVLFDDTSLDEDNGTLNWEVVLDIDDNKTTYYVDANTGSVRNTN